MMLITVKDHRKVVKHCYLDAVYLKLKGAGEDVVPTLFQDD